MLLMSSSHKNIKNSDCIRRNLYLQLWRKMSIKIRKDLVRRVDSKLSPILISSAENVFRGLVDEA
mgnify:CR=1 FL=1